MPTDHNDRAAVDPETEARAARARVDPDDAIRRLARLLAHVPADALFTARNPKE
jgi:hypothetical protein